MEAWLQTQQREVSVAFAARAALRVVPFLLGAKLVRPVGSSARRKARYRRARFALPVFRATAVSWATAKYPAHEKELAHYAAAAAFSVSSFAIAAIAAAAAAAATTATATATTIAAAAAATTATATATTIAAAARAPFWGAVSADATRVEEGAVASVIAGLPLWPNGQPDQLRSLWEEMKQTLRAAKQDWDVWTDWYDDRLAGVVRKEERELAYVRIEDALWGQGPAIVNAEIKRRIEGSLQILPTVKLQDVLTAKVIRRDEEHKPPPARVPEQEPPPYLPEPIENVPSAISFGWTTKATITLVSGPGNWPAFPFKGGEQDHKHRLDACRSLATDTARSLRSGKWNARSDYAETLDQYVAYLPVKPEEGNFLLADAEARIIRAMFAGDADILQVPLAAKLKGLLEQHIGLRAYYPSTEEFYESVRSGHLETPLPIDAVEEFIQGVRDYTPTLFEPNVAGTLENTAQPIPAISRVELEASKSDVAQPMPPPDPLGEVDPEKSQRFTLASGINALWKVASSGKKAGENLEGWSKVIETLGPYAAPILKWLRSFALGG